MILGATQRIEDIIVRFLLRRLSASAQEILAEVTASGTKCSLQAIYHDLRKLMRDGVIIKLKDRYVVRLAWLFSAQLLLNSALSNFVKAREQGLLLNDIGTRSVMRTGSLRELRQFWSGITMGLLINGSENDYLEWSPHAWFILSKDSTESQILDAHRELNLPYHMVIGHDTPLSRRYAEMRRNVPGVVRFAEKSPPELAGKYISIFSSFVITITLPAELVKALDSLFEPSRPVPTKADGAPVLDAAHSIELKVENDKVRAQQLGTQLRTLLQLEPPRVDSNGSSRKVA
jgi:hypothetical protein